jgi:hypothetical protein
MSKQDAAFYEIEARHARGEHVTPLERALLVLRQTGSAQLAFDGATELAQLRAEVAELAKANLAFAVADNPQRDK